MGMASSLALLVVAQAATAPNTLAPLSKWVVSYNRSDCTVLRGFGDPQAPITFGFQPALDATGGEIIFVTPERGGVVRRGNAVIAMSPGTATFAAPWTSAPVASGAKRGLRIDAPRPFWAALPDAQAITVTADHARSVTLEIGPMAHALAAVKACGDDLLRQWGADPAALITPPDGMLEKVFNADRYPVDALLRNGQGEVKTLSEVDGGGAVTACKVVDTSGNARLDQVTCQILMRDVRFGAAAGAAAKRFVYVAVHWLIAAP